MVCDVTSKLIVCITTFAVLCWQCVVGSVAFVAPRQSSGQVHPDAIILGAVLRAEREAQMRSQEEVAHAAGVSLGSYGRIDRGAADASWSTVGGGFIRLSAPQFTYFGN